ncbi:MAG: extracellular solute-binding protein [Thermomicrobiales bacterium]
MKNDFLIPGAVWSRRDFLVRAAAAAGVAVGASVPLQSRPAAAAVRTQSETTINVLTLGEGIFGEPFLKLSPEFTTMTGIAVNNVTMGYNEAIQKQVAAFAAKSGEYDVIQVDYIFVKGYAQAGHLAALDQGLIPADQLESFFADVPDSFKEMYSYDGQTVGMATIGNCQNFIYNEAHLQDAGFEAPDTWDDLLAAAQGVVDPAKERYGFVAGTERLVKATSVWLPIFWANGGALFDEGMKPVFGDETGVAALEFLLQLVETMPPGGAAYTESDEVKAMATGLGTLDPVAWIPDAITTADEATSGQLASRVGPMGSATRAPVMGGLGLVVSNYSENKEAAAQYVAWMNSEEVQKEKIVQSGGQPCRNSAWEANADAKPWFPALGENLKVAKVRPQIPEWGQVDGAIGTQLGRAFAGEVTPAEALAQAQSDVEQVLTDAGYFD